MTIFLRDLFDIPDQVRSGDFVLRLAEGLQHADQTLANYVATPELVLRFDEALGLVRDAVRDRSSKAAFLLGSFGCGKSHFMAVLNLLLQGHAGARSIPELAPLVAKHNAWLAGKKFLLVPYNMIGAVSMESGVLGGYASFLHDHRPEAPTPALYRADAILADARRLRENMGDGAFFRQLNAHAPAAGGWGSSRPAGTRGRTTRPRPRRPPRIRVGDWSPTWSTGSSRPPSARPSTWISTKGCR